jgi:hypothetical protein
LALSGVSMMSRGITRPAATVTAPSMRKIQRHPAIPLAPSRRAIPKARRPLSAPENAEAV